MLTNLLTEIADAARRSNRKPDEIGLVVVSKGQSVEAIKALYDAGILDFGESRVQELVEKRKVLPQDIRWHLIGHLQSKKVPKVIGLCHLIHSVDSETLVKKISDCSLVKSVVTSILLQVNCSGEASKQGFSEKELLDCYQELLEQKGVCIKGLMTMAPLSTDSEVRATFHKLFELGKKLNLPILSMGMSQDFVLAIVEGATLLRIGTRIFTA